MTARAGTTGPTLAAQADRRRRASGARRAPFDPVGDPHGLGVVRVERLPRSHPAPRGASPPPTTPSTVGAPGAGAARLIVGSRPVHHELEAELADWKGTEAAVLFTTGFAANLGVLTTFAGPDTLVCSDELNHASLIDGRRLAGAPLAVYRHRDAAHVDELLRANDPRRAPSSSPRRCSRWTATSRRSTSSLDVCAHHGALLVLDEAHAVLGPHARRAADDVDRAARRHAVEDARRARRVRRRTARGTPTSLVNRARSYIFTTASTPADTAAALAALRVLRSPEGDELRARLRANVDRLRPGHPSPIVPVRVRARGTARSRPRPALLDAAASSSPPSARRRCRRARRGCGSRSRPPHPRPGRPARRRARRRSSRRP